MKQKTVKIGSKNQVVIPKEAKKVARLVEPGRRVSVTALDERRLIIEVLPSNSEWATTTQGVLKSLWKGNDATKTLRQMRNKEWR